VVADRKVGTALDAQMSVGVLVEALETETYEKKKKKKK
jgi:hypothetical protein